MQRRYFFSATLASIAAAPAAHAVAQRRAGGAGRPEWSPAGPRQGRAPARPDATSLTDEERIHVPVLTLPESVHTGRGFDLVVQVGLTAHPMTSDHHVSWVEVTAGDQIVYVIDLSPRVPYPVVRVPLILSTATPLIVRARCTRHGVWLTRRNVAVAP